MVELDFARQIVAGRQRLAGAVTLVRNVKKAAVIADGMRTFQRFGEGVHQPRQPTAEAGDSAEIQRKIAQRHVCMEFQMDQVDIRADRHGKCQHVLKQRVEHVPRVDTVQERNAFPKALFRLVIEHRLHPVDADVLRFGEIL